MRVQDHTGSEFNSRAEMCKQYGIPYPIYKKRLDAGMSIEEALTTPYKETNKERVAVTEITKSGEFHIDGSYPSENFLRYCDFRKAELAKELYLNTGGVKGYKPDMHAVEMATGEFSALEDYKKQIQEQAFWYKAADMFYAGEELECLVDQNTLFMIRSMVEGKADDISRYVYKVFAEKYGLKRCVSAQ